MIALRTAATDGALPCAGHRSARRNLGAIAAAFAHHRRSRDDVMFLKESGEFLLVLAASGAPGGGAAAQQFEQVHAEAPAFLSFFPQYYRLILSIVSDAEALGLPATVAEGLAARVARLGLADGEVSDLQRMEARRLCARQGIAVLRDDTGLDARALRFMNRPDAFAVPNRKAAYDLTHLVYYLSDHGQTPLDLPDGVAHSLLNVGMIALMEEDVDLLSEVCLALRFLGRTPPTYWESYISSELEDFEIVSEPIDEEEIYEDDYHPFLVANWHQLVAGRPGFQHGARPGRLVFRRRQENRCALTEISQVLMQLKDEKAGTVGNFYQGLCRRLSQRSRNVLETVGQSCQQFDEFFYGFCHRGPVNGMDM